MVNSQLFSESNRRGRPRWIRVNDLPFSRVYAYELINSGAVASVLLKHPNSRRGVRLIDSDSLDTYLEGIASGQIPKKKVVIS
jgi:hypothetical protein